jgi:type VI protein secretion system component Hcp
MAFGIPAAHAASFLKIDGIPGEAADAAHKGWIDVQSFSWGLGNAGGPSCANGTPGNRILSFRLKQGPSAEKLMQACRQGKQFPSFLADVNGERHMLQNVAFKGCPATASDEYFMRFSQCTTHPATGSQAKSNVDPYLKIEIKGGDDNAMLILPAGNRTPLAISDLKFDRPNHAIMAARFIQGGTGAFATNYRGMILLQQGARTRQKFPTLTIETRSGRWIFADVLVSSFKAGNEAGAGSEGIALNFAKIEFEYARVDGATSGFHDINQKNQ